MSIAGIKVLTIGKSWKLPHEVMHIESSSHIEETLATFRPDVIITSTWTPGVLQNASFEIRKKWINVPPEAADDAVATAVDNCYRNNLWSESPYSVDHPVMSVFTPTYNTGDYLRMTYQSLRDQTYPTWEWVVVDDCSTDSTWEKLQAFAKEDVRVRPFRSGYRVSKIGEIKGVATELCRGPFLVELDHDDYLHETALMELKNAFKSKPDVGFVYSNHASFYENGAPQRFDAPPWNTPGRYQEVEYKGKKFLETRGPDIYDRFSPDFRHQFGWFLTVGPHHVKAFRTKTFWELGGYNPNLPVADDWDLMARFFLRSKCLHLDKLLYFYRYRDAFGNATFTRNKSIQDHLALGRDNYGREFQDFNEKRLTEGKRNGKGPWHDAVQEVSDRNSVTPTMPEEKKEVIPISPPPGTQAPPWKTLVSFIILDATGSDNAVACVDSIKKYAGVDYEIILIGNGVKSKAESLVTKYQEVEGNLGFAGGCNLGATLATGNFLCFINDDAVLVDSSTIPKLLEKAKLGMVAGPYSNKAKPPQGDLNSPLPVDMYPPMVVGLTMMVSSGLFRLAGGFDTRLLTWEDDDLCEKLMKTGAKCVVVGNTWVWHKGHKTFEALNLDHVKVEEENKAKYKKLHPRIKVIAIAKNEASCIVDFYRQFEGLTKEWYLLDTGSDDNTVELAKSIGVRTVSESFTDFASARNRALTIFDYGRNSWVIMLDPDERLDPETIKAIPNLLWAVGDKYRTFHSRLIAVYPNGSEKEFVPKPFIFLNDGNGKWEFRVHEKWVTPEPYALVTNAVNYHMLEYHDKKKRNNAEDFYSKLMAAEPYFTNSIYKEVMRKKYPILDYDHVDDSRIDKISAGPLISVIIPTYSRIELLQKAIRSALEQTWKTLEVVVVGDKCPDIDKYFLAEGMPDLPHRVRVVNLPKNNGAGGAIPRNVGIQLAASDWIAYLDDDNTWNPYHIEKLFGTILREHTIWGWSSMTVNGVDMKFDRLERGKIDTSCVVHHRSLIAKHGPWKPRTEANYWHDFELFSRWREEPQTVTKYPSVIYNASTSGQAEFLAKLTSSESSKNIPFIAEAKLPTEDDILTVGILGLESRNEMRTKLVGELLEQKEKLPNPKSVHIVCNVDDGTKPIGQKRQEIVTGATSKYLCFVDDDDWVSPHYLSDLLRASLGNPDCITFRGEVQQPGKISEPVRYSLNYPIRIWCKDEVGTHMRTPNHLCPFKTELAKKVPFKAVDYEDALWALHIYPVLQSQCHIDDVLYYYRYNPEISEATKKTPKLIPGLFFKKRKGANDEVEYVDGNNRVFTYEKAVETLNDLFGSVGPQAKEFAERVKKEEEEDREGTECLKDPITLSHETLSNTEMGTFHANQQIVILAPSYGRAEYAAKMLPTSILTAKEPYKLSVIVGVEPQQYKEYEAMEAFKVLGIKVMKLKKGGCYVAALREMAEYAMSFYCNQAILCFSGDDVEYLTRDWDDDVRRAFAWLPNQIGIVGGDDGINGSKFCAAPFVSPEWLDIVGVNPGNYRGMFNDAELDDIAKKAGVRVYLPHVKTIHHHYVNQTMKRDATHDHEATSWESGKREFEGREAARKELALKVTKAARCVK